MPLGGGRGGGLSEAVLEPRNGRLLLPRALGPDELKRAHLVAIDAALSAHEYIPAVDSALRLVLLALLEGKQILHFWVILHHRNRFVLYASC